MPSSKKKMYRIIFQGSSKMYELYARSITQSDMYAFIEVRDLVFGEQSKLVVNPGEEQLRSQFEGVSCTYIPMHSVVRVDEVEKEGAAKVVSVSDRGAVAQFPIPFTPPEGKSKD